jgi:hypothetical protein
MKQLGDLQPVYLVNAAKRRTARSSSSTNLLRILHVLRFEYDPGPKKLLQKQIIVEHVLHQQALLCYLSADNDQANRSNLFR